MSARGRRLAATVSSLLISAVAVLVFPAPAQAAVTVRGQVMCVSQANLVGVWIDAKSGGSGWATRTAVNNYTANYRYSLPNGGNYAVNVGCGGTPQNWATNNKSNAHGGTTNNFTCYDTPSAGWAYLFCQLT